MEPQNAAEPLSASEYQNKRYLVCPFSNTASLVALLCIGSPQSDARVVEAKPQARYLAARCKELGIQTMVLEFEYVDRHFSEDYSGYYVKCYSLYQKKCARIHYFTERFEPDALSDLMLDPPSVRALGYKGFTVVKPLPETLIGRTCLTPVQDHRQYIAPTYTSNLYGVELNVDALPFQEQDHEVAACATSALWSVLHGTAHIFDHQALTPLQITRKALASSPIFRRSLPNDGLTIYQIAAVVRDLGMEVELIDLDERAGITNTVFRLQAAVAAYLPLGIPSVLGLDFNLDDMTKAPQLHAVAISGVEINGPVVPFKKFLLRATRITGVLVHDDGVGPYAPLSLAMNSIVETSWGVYKKTPTAPEKACLTDLLVPVYHQIRVHYSEVLEVVMEFDVVIETIRNYLGLELFQQVEWDIYLDIGTNAKQDVRQKLELEKGQKVNFLTRGLPHYIWRAAAISNERLRFELIFDATDLRQGRWLIDILYYDIEFGALLRDRIEVAPLEREFFKSLTTWAIIEHLDPKKRVRS